MMLLVLRAMMTSSSAVPVMYGWWSLDGRGGSFVRLELGCDSILMVQG
jgi:hypothetical protein